MRWLRRSGGFVVVLPFLLFGSSRTRAMGLPPSQVPTPRVTSSPFFIPTNVIGVYTPIVPRVLDAGGGAGSGETRPRAAEPGNVSASGQIPMRGGAPETPAVELGRRTTSDIRPSPKATARARWPFGLSRPPKPNTPVRPLPEKDQGHTAWLWILLALAGVIGAYILQRRSRR